MPRNRSSKFGKEAVDVATQMAQKANKTDVQTVDTKITNIGNASPKGTYATLSALQTAFPTGTTGIYVVTADGKWYYWSGSAWAAGGIYQSTGIGNKSILPYHLSDGVLKPINGYKASGKKWSLTGNYVTTFAIFDRTLMPAITIGDAIQLNAKIATDHPNVKGVYYQLYENDSSSPAGNGTKSQGTTLPISPSVFDFQVTFNTTVKASNSKFQWTLWVELTDPAVQTDYYIYDLNIVINGITYYPFKVALGYTNPTDTFVVAEYMSNQAVSNEALNNTVNKVNTVSKFNGKTILTLGDSLTEGVAYTNTSGKFQTKTQSILTGLNVINAGSSGADIARMYDIVRNQMANQGTTNYPPIIDYSKVDFVTMMIGTNDGSIPVGTINDLSGTTYTDFPNTFYGYYGKCIEYIWSQKPTARIYIMTPPKADDSIRPWVKSIVNDIRTIANYYGLPLIDCFNESGLCKRNFATFVPDGTHPNQAGNDILGAYIAYQLLAK